MTNNTPSSLLSETQSMSWKNITRNLTRETPTEATSEEDLNEGINSDDATWILTSAFIIFTMQSGFGLLESGMVSKKNEANIMVKNAVDVIYGGLSYWLFGFAFSFGVKELGNGFCGLGYFLTDAHESKMGWVFSKYFFQLSFSTTATTIVSGAMAERTNLKAYTLYSFLNTLTFSFPAHWIWDDHGWLRKMGAVDIAGGSAVHLVGGVSGLVATLMLKPRTGRFDPNSPHQSMASPTNVLLGTFMLWWGWLGFNCGSTFGISGMKWKLASRSAVATINGSIGGGVMGMAYSYLFFKNRLNIPIFVTGILAGLVSITAICSLARPWEALLIGAIGALLACPGCALLEKLQIDDPVGCVPIHFFAGAWGLLSVSLFGEFDVLEKRFSSEFGILKGGPWSFLGVQLLLIVTVSAWAATTTFLELLLVDKLLGLRMSLDEELMGADIIEHGIDENFPSSTNQENENTAADEDNQQRIEIVTLGAIPAIGIDCTLRGNRNNDKDMWRIGRALRPKWQRSVSFRDSRNGVVSNGIFVLKNSFLNRVLTTESLSQHGSAIQENGSAVVPENVHHFQS